VLFGQMPARENGIGTQVVAPNESSVDENKSINTKTVKE